MASVSFLSELADYIAREGIGSSLVAPVNIFVNKYPDQPDNIIAFLGLVGPKPSIDVADFEYPRFQIVVRNTDFVTGEAKMRLIRNLLHDHLALTTEHFVCLILTADSDIIPIGEDDKGRAEFTLNISGQILNNDSGA